MYNQYNPYMNRFYGQQQANIPQPVEIPMQTQNTPQMGLNRAFLNDKQIERLESHLSKQDKQYEEIVKLLKEGGILDGRREQRN